MQQTATTQQLPATVPALNLNAETIRQTFATIKDKQVRACAAMSKITAITSDEEDKAANDLLVKVRLTLDGKGDVKGITEMVRDITKEIDAVRGTLLEPKKAIETEADRIKALRNAWALSKVKQQEAENVRIAKEKAQADEIARIKAAMRESVTNGIVTIVTEMNESIRTFVGKMTLENWDSQAAKLNVKPNLKKEKYEELFNVDYNESVVNYDMFFAIFQEVSKELTYEKVNADYVKSAEGIIKMWVDDLPNMKMELQSAAEMKEVHPVESVEVRQNVAAQIESKAATTAQTIQQQQAAQTAEIARQHDADRLNNEVAATVQQQATTAPKGIRKGRVAVITAPDEHLESTIVAVVRACMSHPKFSGHLKRDRKGTLIGPDKNGNPTYADWLDTLLTFVAKELDTDIPGVTWKETVTTIAK